MPSRARFVTPVIVMKSSPSPTSLSGMSRWGVLVKLNASMRNCSLTSEVMENSRVKPKSQLNRPGPRSVLKPDVEKLGGVGRGTPYYDPPAFADVTEARFGTSGFNTLRGPGLFNWDFGLTREFSITSDVKLQFRMEAFNFTNTPHLDIPDNDVGDGEDFMTITGVTNLAREGIDERQFRLGFRLVF